MKAQEDSTGLPGNARFQTTHWSVVLEAARPGTDAARAAFAQIYLDYRYPLYTYVRRRGHTPEAAEDVVQDFFLRLIEKDSLEGMERAGGKFRSYLLRSLDNFLANEWHRSRTQKRGNGVPLLSLDAAGSEARFALEPTDGETPEKLFERQWVFTLLGHVLERLRAECNAAGKGNLLADLHPHLQGDRQGLPYAEIAARHGLSENAVKVTVHRLRHRYGEMLREEIGRTVGSVAEVDEELRYFRTLCGE